MSRRRKEDSLKEELCEATGKVHRFCLFSMKLVTKAGSDHPIRSPFGDRKSIFERKNWISLVMRRSREIVPTRVRLFGILPFHISSSKSFSVV